jgi:hypothetical protein
MLAAGAPGREPAAADVRADAGLAEVVLRSGSAAVDRDVGLASRSVVFYGGFLCFLDEFSVTRCVIRRYIERCGFGALFRRFVFRHVEAPFEQGRRCGTPGAGEHVVPYRRQRALFDGLAILDSPRARDDVAPGLREPFPSVFQCSTFRTIHLKLELVDLRSDLVFALLSRGVEVGIAVQDPCRKSFPVCQAQFLLFFVVFFGGFLLSLGVFMRIYQIFAPVEEIIVLLFRGFDFLSLRR